tara:strand:- start:599 stop:724 length:126 start_codon:yes stop_codon:yes gene_type:complete
MEMYDDIPMPDGDPLTGLLIVIALYAIWSIIIWIDIKLNKR